MSEIAYNKIVRIFRSDSFQKWMKTQTAKTQSQILSRLTKIEQEGHFGNHKHLKGYLWELKFNNGNRIYYTILKTDEDTLFLILGGNKNGQQKDINKAAKIADEIHSHQN